MNYFIFFNKHCFELKQKLNEISCFCNNAYNYLSLWQGSPSSAVSGAKGRIKWRIFDKNPRGYIEYFQISRK